MIQIKHGDLLSVQSGYIVHGVNAAGVMGSGVAKAIRDKFPYAYEIYRTYYESNMCKVGSINYVSYDIDLCIINAVTQEFYGRDKSRVYVDYNGLRECFVLINDLVLSENFKKVVNFPLIGCGLANGDWNIVSKIIDEELDDSIEKVLWIKE